MKEESENQDEFKEQINTFFEEKIYLLENQIHLINSKLHEPEKKSCLRKNASILISIAA